MSTDEKDPNSPHEKGKPPVRQVVVTHYGKKKKSEAGDVPPEIAPTPVGHIVSSPIDPNAGQGPKLPPAPEPLEAPTLTPAEPSQWAQAAEAQHEENEEVSTREKGMPPPPPPSHTPATVRGNTFIPGAALFLSIIAAGAVVALAFYTYWSQQELSQLQTRLSEDKTSVQSLLTEAKKSLAQLEQIQQADTADHNTFNALKEQLEGAQARLGELMGSQDWRLTQANYLVFMANERLHTSHDISTALAQLEEADQRLATLSNPAWSQLRSALAKDIAKLRSFPTINRQALWEQIGLLSAKLNELNFKDLAAPNVPANQWTVAENAPAWKQALWRSWQELKGIIQISNLEKNPVPHALTEQEQDQLLRTLQLMCEQLQWSILQGNSKIYASNLETLQNWVKEYFQADQTQKDVLDQIQQLLQQHVEIAIPEISDSLQAFTAAMAQLTRKGQ